MLPNIRGKKYVSYSYPCFEVLASGKNTVIKSSTNSLD